MPGFIIGALISGAGSLLGGAISSSGAQSAAQTQANAADQSAQLQYQIYQQQMQNAAPYIQAGGPAVSDIASQYGLGPGGTGIGPANASLYQNFGANNPAQNALYSQYGGGPGGGIGSANQALMSNVYTPFGPSLDSLAATPGYQFQLQQGDQGILDAAHRVVQRGDQQHEPNVRGSP